MASFKLILSDYVKRNGKQRIELQVTIGRHAIPRRTEYEVYKKDWDAAKERVRPSNKNFSSINNALGRLLEDAEREFADRDAQGQVPSSKEIVEATFANHDFYEFAQSRIDAMNGETEIRTKRKYITWLAGLKEYAPALAFAQITADFVSGYKAHLKSKGNKHSTIVGRLSTFRATVNAAPAHLRGTAFKETTVGTYRAAENKTALSIQDITTLWNYHAQTLGEALVRDAFLFSY